MQLNNLQKGQSWLQRYWQTQLRTVIWRCKAGRDVFMVQYHLFWCLLPRFIISGRSMHKYSCNHLWQHLIFVSRWRISGRFSLARYELSACVCHFSHLICYIRYDKVTLFNRIAHHANIYFANYSDAGDVTSPP